ncbi:MAG: hypothetical protein HDS99_04810 [Bacteroidales bacterium]|nr:hypothetical protein [Bacteroidales bacterium]
MKLNKYFSTLLGGLMLFGAWACTDKIEPVASPEFAGNDVYFSSTESDEVDIPMDASQVNVNIFRVKAADAQTVNLTATFQAEDEEGNLVACNDIFSVPATVTFAQGEKKAEIPVTVNFAKVEAGAEYYMTVKIEGDVTSVYGESEKTFVLSYSQWSDWDWYDTPATQVQWALNGPMSESGEAGTLSPADLEDSMDENGDYYFLYYDGQIITRKSLINSNLTQIAVGGARYSNFYFDLFFTIDDSKNVEVDGKQYPYVTFELFDTHYTDDNGAALFVGTCHDVLIEFGYTPGTADWNDVWVDNDLKECYYDPNTGVIHFFPMFYFEGAKSPYLPQESFVFLPGFADYSLEFSYNGNFVNKKGVENAVIGITRSEDVASYVYDVKYGALSAEQVNTVGEALVANTDLELIYDVSKEVMIPCTEEGTYTIVAAMYDQTGNSVGFTSYQFKFESVMKESAWTSVGLAYMTDDIMTGMFQNYGGDTYEVECEQYKEDPNIYRLVDPLEQWYENKYIIPTGTPGYIIFDVTVPNAVYIFDSPLGFSVPDIFESDEEVYMIDQAYGLEPQEMIQLGVNGVLEDGVITFPAVFKSNGKEYSTLLLSTESFWAQGMGMRTNTNGAFEIYMPESTLAAPAAKKAKADHSAIKSATPKRVTVADRGFISVAKRKAAKAQQQADALKAFHKNNLVVGKF